MDLAPVVLAFGLLCSAWLESADSDRQGWGSRDRGIGTGSARALSE